jgi:hypothetical protein
MVELIEAIFFIFLCYLGMPTPSTRKHAACIAPLRAFQIGNSLIVLFALVRKASPKRCAPHK